MATKLTSKQTLVLSHLSKGRSVAEVGEALGISANGVYGHIRKIKAAGVTVPKAQTNGHAATTPAAAPKPKSATLQAITLPASHEDVLKVLHEAKENAGRRITLIEVELKELHNSVAARKGERDTLLKHIANYDKALLTVAPK